MPEADFVIIGAGSAGSALAARLSEDGRHSVIVIEFGGTDAGPFIQMPAALSYPMNMKRYDWGFRTEPERHLGGRRLACPRGKVIGGSSSINGMVYVRGHALDFDHWAEAGAEGWGFADVLPYFKKMETSHGGQPGWRGTAGPLHVRRGGQANPLQRAFVQAGAEAGHETTLDYNGEKQDGFGAMEQTIWQGRRWSAASAYLKPALKRANVRLVRGLARRIVMDGRRAIGVEIEGRRGVTTIAARREVIVAASAINSPKLLMLSGIGPAGALQKLSIAVTADRPGVGANLQDHLEVMIQQRCRQPITLNGRLSLWHKALIGAEWLFFRTGDGASNHYESVAFLRSRPDVPYPDVQFHFLPAAIRYDGQAPCEGHGYQVQVGPMRSEARGNVRLTSPRPEDAPAIRFNYMSAPDDWRDFRTCIAMAREVFAQPAFTGFCGGEIAPGPHVTAPEDVDAYVRDTVESAYHPCGTCRMGAPDDPMSVVDPQCRVIGVEGLRVVDSSIFPRITNGNINAPSIMVGEKAADHILGRPTLARANLRPWVGARSGPGETREPLRVHS